MIKDEKISPVERLSVARHSDDLTLHDEYRSDVDYLIGGAMASMRCGKGAEALVNLRNALDPKAWGEAMDRAVHLTVRIACRSDWKLEPRQLRELARMTLKHWVLPVCPKCSGRKFDEIPGTHRLGNRPCPACHGTGERPLPRGEHRRMTAILAALDADQSNINTRMRQVLGLIR